MNNEIRLTEEQVKELFKNKKLVGKIDAFRQDREKSNKKWKKFVNRNTISQLTDNELITWFNEYYKIGAGRHGFNQIYRDRITRDIKKFREMLKFLMDESVDIKRRINEVLGKNGKYKIDGVGKALVTSILFDFNSDKYCIWNNKVNAGLERIGWLPKLRGTFGDKYVQILNTLKQLRDIIPSPYNNFNDIDSFLHIIAVEKEGEIALQKVLGEYTEEDELSTSNFELLEKTLKEILVKNFSTLFPTLEIYEDEESKAIEYPTGVGRIDILAVEKGSNNKVVIELKAGVASTNVLGQILSYMQWVEENLSENNKKVRGIVIAKDIDKKLRYALKKAGGDIEFIKYDIKIDLTKVNQL